MKKLSLILVAMLLVCSCAFAANKVSFGLGFGGQFVPAAEEKVYDAGPALFVGYDYIRDNGLTVYDDVALNMYTYVNGEKLSKEALGGLFVASESAGIGYTYAIDQFTVFGGAGISARVAFGKLIDEVCGKLEKPFAAVGAGLRIKGTYTLNEKFDITFQINPVYELKIKNSDFDGKVISGNAVIGLTYAF